MRGVVEYNPAARARPPRLVRESSHTPVFEEAEIVAFLDSISSESLKDIRGVNFALYSEHATAVDLCLFDSIESSQEEVAHSRDWSVF
jgi:hypothetical protein